MLARVAHIDAVGAARPDVIGLLGTARYCAPAAPFSFVGSIPCATRPRFRGLSRRAQRCFAPSASCCGTGGLTLLSPRSRLCQSPQGGWSPIL